MLSEFSNIDVSELGHLRPRPSVTARLSRNQASVSCQERSFLAGQSEILPVGCAVNLPSVPSPFVGIGHKAFKTPICSNQTDTLADQKRCAIYGNFGSDHQTAKTQHFAPVSAPRRNGSGFGRRNPPRNSLAVHPVIPTKQPMEKCSCVAAASRIMESPNKIVGDGQINRPHFPFRLMQAVTLRFHRSRSPKGVNYIVPKNSIPTVPRSRATAGAYAVHAHFLIRQTSKFYDGWRIL